MRTHPSQPRSSASWLAALRPLSRPFRRWFSPRRAAPILTRSLRLEALETRDLPSVVSPMYIVAHPLSNKPLGAPGPVGYSPAQIVQAYGFNQISFNGVTGNGSGQTIAIVDAYNTPTITGDLAAFDVAESLAAPPSFKVVNQSGGNTLPMNATPGGWGLETSLDVEWAHSVAPGANILLVESNTENDSDMYAAVQYAAGVSGVCVISMSWGDSEAPSELGNDGYFTHAGVTYVAASGDSGSPPIYPSASPNVLAVGGTSLSLSNGNYGSESAWSGSGGGISAFESAPPYQQGLVIYNGSSNGMRTTPDVSYNANPGTGVGVLDDWDYAGWVQVGGTSAAAPQWSGLIAIANQGRALEGLGSLSGASQTLPDLYALPQSDFHDITTGSSISTSTPPGPNYAAGPGYDLATGRGTPMANLIVNGLMGPVQVLYGSLSVTNNTGNVSVSAITGSTTTYTFTVTNLTANTLTLQDPISLPTGFTLVSDFGNTTLAGGVSTTFTVGINTATATTYSGTVSFGISNANNNSFSFTLTGTVGSTIILDDSQLGFSATSGWLYASGSNYSQYYDSNTHYILGGVGSKDVASWTFTVAPGTYQVSATWVPYSNRATNAQYTVLSGSSVLATTTVNQQQAPGSFSDAGAQWQNLGAGNLLDFGTSLTVDLSGAGNGYLIADAMRIHLISALPQAPAVQVSEGATVVANNGSVNFGSTLVGAPLTQTFTVTDTGTQALTLGSVSVTGAGFTLSAAPGATTLASGATTTFAVQLSAAAGSYSGNVSFTTNDPNNLTFTFAVSGTVSTTEILDDSQPGFSATSGWLYASGSNYSQYYDSNTHYILGSAGSQDVATWAVNVGPGVYRVSVTWVPFSNRATNAQYTVLLGSSVLGSSTVNQQQAPSSFSDAGAQWQNLGASTLTVTSAGTLSVQLAGTGNGYLIADAVRVQYLSALPNGPQAQVSDGSTAIADGTGSDSFGTAMVGGPVTKTFTVKNAGNQTLTLSDPISLPSGFSLASDFGSTSLAPGATTTFAVTLTAAATGTYSGTLSFGTNDANNNPYTFTVSGTVSTTVIIDDSGAGFSATSGWLYASGSNYSQYYDSNTHYILGSPGSQDVATWAVNVGPGVYRVSATWVPFSNRATNAQYTVLLGSSVQGSATINQQVGPSSFSDAGAQWQDLGAGTFTVTSAGTLSVQLAGTGNGYLIADAVRIQKVG